MQAARPFGTLNKLVVKATYSSYPYEPLLSLSQEKTQLALDRLLTDWAIPEEPEPLVINEVLCRVTPVFRPPHHPSWSEKGQGVQGHYTSEEDTEYSASSPPPPRALRKLASQAAPSIPKSGCCLLLRGFSWRMGGGSLLRFPLLIPELLKDKLRQGKNFKSLCEQKLI